MFSLPTPKADDAAATYHAWRERHASQWPEDHHIPLMAWSHIVYSESIAFRKRKGGYLLALQLPWLLACIEREFPDMGVQDSVGGITVDIDRERWPELADAAEAAANDFAAFYAQGNHIWRMDMIPPTRRADDWAAEREAAQQNIDALGSRAKATRRAYNAARQAAWGGSSTPPRHGEAPKPAKPRGPKPAATAVQPRNRGNVTACWFCEPENGHHQPGCLMGQMDEALA